MGEGRVKVKMATFNLHFFKTFIFLKTTIFHQQYYIHSFRGLEVGNPIGSVF
jgi:hypothetical protein